MHKMLRRCAKKLTKQQGDAVKKLLQCDLNEVQGQPLTNVYQRFYARVPQEYESYYGSAQQAIRRQRPVEAQPETIAAAESAVKSAEAAQPVASPDATAASQKYAAESATRWMFPWEKRQMSGERGPLTTFERLYWGVFVSAIAFLLWSKVLRSSPVEDENAVMEKAEKERKRLRAARLLAAGQELSEDDEEQLEGMSPDEIQSFVQTHIGLTSDPFEGLSPEEINDLLAGSAPSSVTQLQ